MSVDSFEVGGGLITSRRERDRSPPSRRLLQYSNSVMRAAFGIQYTGGADVDHDLGSESHKLPVIPDAVGVEEGGALSGAGQCLGRQGRDREVGAVNCEAIHPGKRFQGRVNGLVRCCQLHDRLTN